MIRTYIQEKLSIWRIATSLFLTRRQTTKIRNVFSNISTDIKLNKALISKITQSIGFLRNMIGISGKKVITGLAFPLAIDNLPGLVSNLASNTRNKF